MAERRMSVAEAAARLGMSPAAIRHLVANGDLDAERFAGRISIPSQNVQRLGLAPRPSGRPFAPSGAWAILRMLSHQDVEGLSAPRRSQLRRHLRDDDSEGLAGRLRARAVRHGWYVHPSLHDNLVASASWLSSGRSALEQVNANLIGRVDPLVEGYLPAADLDHLAEAVAADRSPVAANVIVRAVGEVADVPSRIGVAAPAVVALDLIESGEARAVDAGWELWHGQMSRWRQDHR